jgi:hypothetical protein
MLLISLWRTFCFLPDAAVSATAGGSGRPADMPRVAELGRGVMNVYTRLKSA